MQDCRVDTLE